ncbi:MAG: T9SS type A sorting domain-containing protein [bacterium]|nr:T9SS type A sorting domain-containing protein [bacterium]
MHRLVFHSVVVFLLCISGLFATANSVAVGDTRTFWVTSFVNWPLVIPNSDKYETPATCRAVTDHCYIFVQDSAWGTGLGVVTQSHVDDFVTALETRTPARTDSGLMETIPTTCGAFPNAIDRDEHVYVLITRFQDLLAGMLLTSYFDRANQMSNTISRLIQLGYSEEVELIYVNANYVSLPFNTGRNQAHGGCTAALGQLCLNARDMLDGPLVFDGIPEWLKLKNGYPNAPLVGINYPQQFWNDPATRLDPDIATYSLLDITSRYKYLGAFVTFWQYLSEQLGNSAVRAVAVNSLPGSTGFNSAMSSLGTDRRFTDLFEDWSIANKLDDSTTASIRYYHRNYNPSVVWSTTTTSYPDTALGDTLPGNATRYHRFQNYNGGDQKRLHFIGNNGGTFQVYRLRTTNGQRAITQLAVTNGECIEELAGTETALIVMNEQLLGSATYQIVAESVSTIRNPEPTEQSSPQPFTLSGNSILSAGAGNWTISLTSAAPVSIALYDVAGRQLYQNEFVFSTGLHTINLANVLSKHANGTYFLRANTPAAVAIKKIIWLH